MSLLQEFQNVWTAVENQLNAFLTLSFATQRLLDALVLLLDSMKEKVHTNTAHHNIAAVSPTSKKM